MDTQITIRGGDPAVLDRIGRAVADAAAGRVTLLAPGATCGVCATVLRTEDVRRAAQLPDVNLCPICHQAALRLVESFKAGARRGYSEFKSQLPGMIRDLRAGCDEPTFYRGIEG